MRITIQIEDGPSGSAAVEVDGEGTAPARGPVRLSQRHVDEVVDAGAAPTGHDPALPEGHHPADHPPSGASSGGAAPTI